MNIEKIVLEARKTLSSSGTDRANDAFIDMIVKDCLRVNGLSDSPKDQSPRLIPDEAFSDGADCLGKLYQAYISPDKDEAFTLIAKGGRLDESRLTAATQIFTPRWIADYMAQNSIGRAARDSGALSNDAFERVKAKWRYYIDDVDEKAHAPAIDRREVTSIQVTDPCMGAGRLLLSAFDVLMDIYREAGYSPRDAARFIATRNLSGLDIDKNASRIAREAIAIKVRGFGGDVSLDELASRFVCIKNDCIGSLRRSINPLGRVGELFDVVLANPPYMSSANMPPYLASYVSAVYPTGKSDLFAAFIIRCRELTAPGGYTSVITQHAWMFLKSFFDLRTSLLKCDLVNMLHLGSRAFEEIGGEVVQTAAFVMRNAPYSGGRAAFYRLVGEKSSEEKESAFLSGKGRFLSRQDSFGLICGSPVAYWANEAVVRAFKNKPLKSFASPKQGLATGDNGRFIRMWHEVAPSEICFCAASRSDALASKKRFFPFNKGGKYRKWYGNDDYVVDWSNDGHEIRTLVAKSGRLKSRAQNLDSFFMPSVTWSKISSGDIAFRYKPKGFIFDVSGTSMFADEDMLFYLLAFCNSSVALEVSRILSPTMNFEVGQIASFPVIIDESKDEIAALARRCVDISKRDWDSFETSWDFSVHPMLENRVLGGYDDQSAYAETSFGLWKLKTNGLFAELKSLEEEINRRFAAIYKFDDAQNTVDDGNVSIRRIFDAIPSDMRKSRFVLDKRDAVVSLISYAIGCAFGRFKPFGDDFGRPDRIITISERPDETDAVRILKEFLVKAYSAQTLSENMRFIALALSNGADATEKAVYGYFYKKFYSDHVKTYKSRPIYWLFFDGRYGALVYMFGFNKDTVRRVMLSRQSAGLPFTQYDAALEKACAMPMFDINDGVIHNYDLFMNLETPQSDGGSITVNLLSSLD